MNYIGTIIGESLSDIKVLDEIKVLETTKEIVTNKHRTPWLKQWTLYKIEVDEADADKIALEISSILDYSHKSAWYVDYKNSDYHYIIYKDKIFKVPRQDIVGYMQAQQYGIGLGIPEYQVNFSSQIGV